MWHKDRLGQGQIQYTLNVAVHCGTMKDKDLQSIDYFLELLTFLTKFLAAGFPYTDFTSVKGCKL